LDDKELSIGRGAYLIGERRRCGTRAARFDVPLEQTGTLWTEANDVAAMNLFRELANVMSDLASALGRHPVGLTQAALGGAAAQFLIGHTLGGYYDGLVKRADRWLRGGEPVAGLGTFQGRVIAVRDPQNASPEAGRRPVVRIVRTQRHAGNDLWRDVHVEVVAEPFRLELLADREVEVLANEPLLSGFEEMSVMAPRALREIRSEVFPDEQVWVTGYLEPAVKGMGAYRGGGGSPRRLREPRGGKVWITRQAPAEEWRKLATAHRRGGWAALGALGFAIAIAYSGTLSVWLDRGPEAAPPMSPLVVAAWIGLGMFAAGVWARGYRSARREWAQRFPWL
jgi:hypothetical protein